jgi:hypothetical protein
VGTGSIKLQFFGNKKVERVRVIEEFSDDIFRNNIVHAEVFIKYDKQNDQFYGHNFSLGINKIETKKEFFGALRLSSKELKLTQLPLVCWFKKGFEPKTSFSSHPKLTGVLPTLFRNIDQNHTIEVVVVFQKNLTPGKIDDLLSIIKTKPGIEVVDSISRYVLVKLNGKQSLKPFYQLLSKDEVKYAGLN